MLKLAALTKLFSNFVTFVIKLVFAARPYVTGLLFSILVLKLILATKLIESGILFIHHGTKVGFFN